MKGVNMSDINNLKTHLADLKVQLKKQKEIGNYRKAKDLQKGINRLRKEISDYEYFKQR